MKLTLLSLEIKNFKGCKSLTLEPKGKDLSVYGENETGKSTIQDAWSWLLFGKDRLGQSTRKFDIKPLDENNEPIHHLETMVKATLDVDGSQLTLKKKYYEEWKKKKGSADEVFDGHTKDHYISGAPVSQSAYNQKVEELADERTFRLLTDPLYFNSQLHWKKRRDVLLDMQGVTNDEIFAANEDLEPIREAVEKRGIEGHKDFLDDAMDGIEEDKEKIPPKIEENYNNLPDVSGLDWKEIELEIEKLKEQKKSKEQELARTENGGEIAEKKKRLAEIDGELQEIKNEHTAKYDEEITSCKNQLSDIKDHLDSVERKINKKEQSIEDKQAKIENLKNDMELLKREWYQKQEEKEELIEKEWEGDKKCYACGQELPEEQIEEARAKFNRDKAEQIEKLEEEKDKINQDGLQKKEEVEHLQAEIEEIKSKIEKLESKYDDLVEEADELQEEISNLKEKSESYHKSEEFLTKHQEKGWIEEEIAKLQKNNKFSLQKIDKEITALTEKIEAEQDKLKEIEAYNKGQKRIEELKKEERKLAKKYEELEREMALCEQFEKTRAELLEEKVNGLFDMATFKLFEVYQNGSIKPTCRTLYKGIPYNTNLNDGHKIRVGLDIIDTLSRHYGFRAPVFVDNAESITGEIKTKSQLIRLKAHEVEELVVLREGEVDIDKFIRLWGVRGAISKLIEMGKSELAFERFDKKLVAEITD